MRFISRSVLLQSQTRVQIHLKQHHQRPEEKDPCLQYVFRTYSTQKGRFCLGLTYRPSEMKITAFLSGLHDDEIQELFTLIESQRMYLVSPMLIPTLLAGFGLKYVRNRLYHCHKITNTVKHKMGLASNVMTPSFREPSINDSLELSQSLTTIFGKLAKYDQHCGSLLDLFRVLDEASQSCLEATLESYKIIVGEATALVRTLISHMACSTQSSRDWTEFLHRRAQGYVQTVYSLIAQRDNSLSIQLAESSLRIAEATRSDNLAMKAIAENSRIIAEESKIVSMESLRKNDTMRSIAVVTMLFLPATFIATLFSTSFFNFQSKDGPVVSHWIWLYVLVTAIMTAVIQGLWFLNARNVWKIGKTI
jgi:Mg2+ and Co2+ transporter CorA